MGKFTVDRFGQSGPAHSPLYELPLQVKNSTNLLFRYEADPEAVDDILPEGCELKGGDSAIMQALVQNGGRIRPRVAIAKIIASALCIGTGGSAGREGPIVQVGSALGSSVGQVLRLSDERIKNLVACGAAAGIAVSSTKGIACFPVCTA